MRISVFVNPRAKADGTRSVFLKFRPKGGSPFIIGTGIDCRLEPEGMVFPDGELNGRAKSVRLMELYAKCEEFVYFNPGMPPGKLRDRLTLLVTGRGTSRESVDDVFRLFVETKHASTGSTYLRTCGKVMEFDGGADFESMDVRWLERFSRWLRKGGANVNGVAHHMRNLRAVFNFALDEELTRNYPFRKYRIRGQQTGKRDLTAEQLRRLRDFPCEPFQRKYVDLFFLMFYLCGINAGDLFLLTDSNVNNGRIEYYRQKTGKYYSIRIEPEAEEIIDRYRGRDWLLDVMDTNVHYSQPLKRMNQQLKKVGMDYHEGGKWTGDALFPDLSSYYARHSWASIAAEVDVPMDVIAQALGHATPYSTTDIYVNRRLKKIDEANRRVIDFLECKVES